MLERLKVMVMNDTNTANNLYLNDEEILEQCRKMARTKVNEVLDINEHLLGTPQSRIILEEQLYGVMLQIFSYFRNNMMISRKEKQRQGIAAAKAAGIRMGRRQKYVPEDYIDVFVKYRDGEISLEQAMSEIGSCRGTFERLKKELQDKELI